MKFNELNVGRLKPALGQVWRSLVLLILFPLLLTACDQKSKVLYRAPGYESLTEDQLKVIAKENKAELEKRRIEGYSDKEIQDMLVNKTVLFVGGRPLNQVEYYSADGNAYLWYPGNQSTVVGKWRLEDNKRICFQYSDSSYDPLAKNYGGEFKCKPLADWFSASADRKNGDIFLLTSGKLPKTLESSAIYFTLDDLKNGKATKF